MITVQNQSLSHIVNRKYNEPMMNREVLGSIETVKIPEFGIEVVAKVDTGAWSGSLHCTNIREENDTLFFFPLGDDSVAQSTTEYEKRTVRSTSGHIEHRYLVPVTIEVKGVAHKATLGITDRSEMTHSMLIGRKFLIENNILVDVTLTVDEDHEAERYL